MVDFTEDDQNTSKWATFYSSDAASPNKPELVVEYLTEAPEPEPEPEPQVRRATIYNYYDYGYSWRNNQTTSASRTAINNYMSAVANRFNQLFGIIITAPNAILYESPMDQCKNTAELGFTHACEHDNHVLQTRIMNGFVNSHNFAGQTIGVLWSGHDTIYMAFTDDDDPTNDRPDSNRSMSDPTTNTVLMVSLDVSAEQSKSIFFHELCHQFNALDHYHDPDENDVCRNANLCDYCNPSGGLPSTCIMDGSRTVNINSTTVLCDYCKFVIEVNMDGYFLS